jgi:hypothetical protein
MGGHEHNYFKGKIIYDFGAVIWSVWAPLRCKMATRLFVRGRVWTADRLSKRGLPHIDKCVLCNAADENAHHLLTGYAVVNIIWGHVLNLANLQQITPVMDLNSLVILITWSVWWERNTRVFDRCSKPINILIEQIKAEAKLWLLASKGHLNLPGV